MKRNMLLVLMILFLGSTLMVAQTHKGVIFGAYVTYKSSTEIYVTAGSGRCNDNLWENAAETTLDLYSVLPAGEDFVYIYIDDSASSYPTPTFIGSTTEPAWSNTNIGWYNGDDRCIGVVWCDSTGNIKIFQNNSLGQYVTDGYLKEILSSGNPNGDRQTVEATAYIPINAVQVYVEGYNTDSTAATAHVCVMISSYENTSAIVDNYGAWVVMARGWVPLPRNSSRDLKWYGQDDDDNNFRIRVRGYRIER